MPKSMWTSPLIKQNGQSHLIALKTIIIAVTLPSTYVFHHDIASVEKAKSRKKQVTGVKELDWPLQSPDLRPKEHHLDKLCDLGML